MSSAGAQRRWSITLAPGVEGSAHALEHRLELVVGVVVGLAVGVVPDARQVDPLEGAHGDRLETQLAERIAGGLHLGIPLPGENGVAAVRHLAHDVLGDEALDLLQASQRLAAPAGPSSRGRHRDPLAPLEAGAELDVDAQPGTLGIDGLRVVPSEQLREEILFACHGSGRLQRVPPEREGRSDMERPADLAIDWLDAYGKGPLGGAEVEDLFGRESDHRQA